MLPVVTFNEWVYLGDLSPARRESVQRCRNVQNLVRLAEEREYYKNYDSCKRNLIIFHAYCTGLIEYARIAEVTHLSTSSVGSILNRVIINTLGNEGKIIMKRAKKGSILIWVSHRTSLAFVSVVVSRVVKSSLVVVSNAVASRCMVVDHDERTPILLLIRPEKIPTRQCRGWVTSQHSYSYWPSFLSYSHSR